ncbi:hypothetical protein D621_20110 [beta proteobacterium AAP51]|nr:hypothetical protein D621_20110 [beta proteobacterium AAP51]
MLMVAALHLAAGWGLLQWDHWPQAVQQAVPLVVALLTPEVAPDSPPAQLPPPQARLPAAASWPIPPVAEATPTPAPLAPPTASVAPPEPAPPQAPTPHPAPATRPAEPTATPPVAAAPRPATRLRVPPEAVAYLVPPPAELPLASRRAGETGVVWLRVVVDARGRPAMVQLHRSSGHARLDAQALEAMRQARFRPHTEDGVAVEVEVVAPIEYALE